MPGLTFWWALCHATLSHDRIRLIFVHSFETFRIFTTLDSATYLQRNSHYIFPPHLIRVAKPLGEIQMFKFYRFLFSSLVSGGRVQVDCCSRLKTNGACCTSDSSSTRARSFLHPSGGGVISPLSHDTPDSSPDDPLIPYRGC